LTELKLGKSNPIATSLSPSEAASADGRLRFPSKVREEIYRALIETVRELAPGLEISLCLEDPSLLTALKLDGQRDRCNCVL
jgi:hypothetical protein